MKRQKIAEGLAFKISGVTDPFSYVRSSTTPDDRKSLLAVQQAAKETSGQRYSYLEVGSDLGGTIQIHIADPACERIYSIDKRPLEQPDERGRTYSYENNSTARMIEHLGRIPGAEMRKLVTFDAETSEVPVAAVAVPPAYCLVDGEHTDRAIQADFLFCEAVSGRALVFLAHDAHIVYRGLKLIAERLARDGVFFRALLLPSHFLLIDLAGKISAHPAVQARALEGWRGYLDGLLTNDWYRQEYLKLGRDPKAIAI